MGFEVHFEINSDTLKHIVKEISMMFNSEFFEDEQGNLILMNKKDGIRITIYVSEGKYKKKLPVLAIVRDNNDLNMLIKCLGKPKSKKELKPTIVDFARVLVELYSEYKSEHEKIINEIISQFGLNKQELKMYFNAILTISNSRRANSIIKKASEIVSKLKGKL